MQCRTIILKFFTKLFYNIRYLSNWKFNRKPSTVCHFVLLYLGTSYSAAIFRSHLIAYSTFFAHPVKDGQHHVELLLLLLLGHVTRRVAQLREETAQVHEAQCVVLRAALVLPRPPHDPLHHVHLRRLLQAKAGPETKTNQEPIISYVFNTYNRMTLDSVKQHH